MYSGGLGRMLLAALDLDRIRFAQRRPVMTVVLATGVAAAALVQGWPVAARAVTWCCDERAEQAWPVALAHLPGSLVAPAPGLPLWGALAQVLLVVGLAECLHGWRVVAVVGLLSHVAATVAGHLMVAAGTTALLGLGSAVGSQHDSGPSALVIGVGAFAALRVRSWPLLGLTFAVPVTEAVLRPDLAGREHLVALVVGLVVGLAVAAAGPRAARDRAWAGQRSLRLRGFIVAASTLALTALGATGSALADPDTSVSTVALVAPGTPGAGGSFVMVSGAQLHDRAWLTILRGMAPGRIAVWGPLDTADVAAMRALQSVGISSVRVLPVTAGTTSGPRGLGLDRAESATTLVLDRPPTDELRWWARWRGVHLIVITNIGGARGQLVDLRRLRPEQLGAATG
ncbi:MAG: hypothetical protein M3P23_07610 [Actinomycetota bacterium]|nr:hypothetical protein [Actinomycetota bacterium]